jgi:hypothetical protein
VSSPAAAWLEKLESSGFFTPAERAVAHQVSVGTTSTSPVPQLRRSHYCPLRSRQIQSAYEELPRLNRGSFASGRETHNFPLISGYSHVFPFIPGYFVAKNQSSHSARIACILVPHLSKTYSPQPGTNHSLCLGPSFHWHLENWPFPLYGGCPSKKIFSPKP